MVATLLIATAAFIIGFIAGWIAFAAIYDS
jgi:hypothetical protein